MSISVATRCLIKNTWYLTSTGFKYGYIFVNGSRVEQADEGEPPPELELAELMYDFNGDAVITHGYSLLVDIVEYNLRGLPRVDLSIYTREELKKLAKVGVVNAYTNGVTLPVAWTSRPEIVADVARENSIRVGVIAERGVVSRNPFTVLIELDNGQLYVDDRAVGRVDEAICSPRSVSDRCFLIDARGYGNLTTATEEVYSSARDVDTGYKLLTSLYRVTNIDNGYIEAGSSSDLVIHDLKNPLKSIPIAMSENLYRLLSRSQQPDVVFIGGDIFYDHGENLAIPVVKVHELFKAKYSRDNL